MASKFESAYSKAFAETIRSASLDIGDDAAQKLQASAQRTAALIEIAIRTPHRAESIQTALKMEVGIAETVLAQAAVDGAQAIRDAALTAAGVLIDLALRA